MQLFSMLKCDLFVAPIKIELLSCLVFLPMIIQCNQNSTLYHAKFQWNFDQHDQACLQARSTKRVSGEIPFIGVRVERGRWDAGNAGII